MWPQPPGTTLPIWARFMNPQDIELKRAAFDGDLDRVQALIAAGADVNACDEHGAGTLLTFHPDVIRMLLSHGADPNRQTNENGVTVLAGLCFVNVTECVRLLLEGDADPNRGRVESGETPLHHALAGHTHANARLVQLLIDHGADVNAKTVPAVASFNLFGGAPTRGESPLHRAAAYASRTVIELLLAAGADPRAEDARGERPVHWAGWHRRPRELVDLLRTE
ncbi:Ankyrin repeat protein [Maioricimonas rarisocia]|uniref:Ankyrin repeat protein n=1 Tax=Maioricimonas rarisocia TaxID=2528026 RepID=A0A517ZEK5_9PLAN|nr:ankyrin repeat domain-containing protein [Maioricimonas rarisocia]QDU40907.1 Ankyrin repeat protein [Maioricimonas rarisocia]